MLGWTLIFALTALFGIFSTLTADLGPAFFSIKAAAIMSGVLFLACVLTPIARRAFDSVPR